MSWTDLGDLCIFSHGITPDVTKTYPIASFDLDSTLVDTKKGNRFAKDANDWKLLPNVSETIQKTMIEGKKLVIFTNQGWKDDKKIELFQKRMENIHVALDSPDVLILAAVRAHSKYRKPSPAMFEYIQSNFFKVDKNNSVYVGDAAGRPNDFEDTDRTFALNIGIPFYTPELYFLNQTKGEPYQLKVNLATLPTGLHDFTPLEKDIILCVGMMGSGKSQFVRNYLISHGYVHINQDTLKTKDKCLKTFETSLKGGKQRIVVDNTNPSSLVRGEYIEIAQKYRIPVRILHFTASENLCKHNNAFRAKQGATTRVPDIAYAVFKKNFEIPDMTEGCTAVIEIPFKVAEDAPKEYFMYYV